MKKFIAKLKNNLIVRYVFFGGLTVMANMVSFAMLSIITEWSVDLCNSLSIVIALVFAYFVNTYFVFETKGLTIIDRIKEFLTFLLSRLLTMLIEFVGVHIFVTVYSLNSFLVKTVFQIIVIIMNYLLSKLIVYKKR